jgi:Holliday junction resolvase RusA-like endonuclease
MSFTVTLPAPPSRNALFVNARRGRVRSVEYLSWLIKAALIIDATRAGTAVAVVSPVAVIVRAGRSDAARDLSNLIRPAQDLIVRCGVIPDDSVRHVKRCIIEEDAATPDGWISIHVETLI